MDDTQYLAAIARDSAAFAESASVAGLSAPVTSCPGWSMADLVWHLTEVHYFWGTVIEDRVSGWAEVVRITRVPDHELLAKFMDMRTRLVQILATTDATTEVWTWSAQHDVAFVIRRMAQETAVHRWDADQAAGRAEGIDAELASDGIDEFLEHFLDDVNEGAEPIGGSVHIHCGDVPGEWTITVGDDGYDVRREHAKGDCALRGGASDLLLALWRRVGTDAVDVVGDAGVAARFLAATNLN